MNNIKRVFLAVATGGSLWSIGAVPVWSFSFDLPDGFDQQLAKQYDTSLYFYSQSSSSRREYIGQGKEWFYGPQDGVFAASKNFDNGVNFGFNNRAQVGFQDSVFWRVSFAAPFETPLEVGFYDNATRFPFQDAVTAGLSASGDGRGCNRLGGRFEVLEVAYDDGNTIESFDAVFAQYCENESAMGTPALFGRVRYNAELVSNDTTEVPEPTILAGLAMLGLYGLARRR